MANIAFIPARSGSKRFTNKNIQPLLGLELFLWSIRSAAKSTNINRIIFSTDSDEYNVICERDSKLNNYSYELDKRTAEEAGDQIKIYDYIRSKDFLERNQIDDNDTLVLLLPTCPLRPKRLIDKVIEKSNNENLTVFTCCEYDFHVTFAFSIDENNYSIEPLFNSNSPLITGVTRSQDQKIYFRPNGAAVAIPVPILSESSANSIYYKSIAHKMDIIYSCDVDTSNQLSIASATAETIKKELQYLF